MIQTGAYSANGLHNEEETIASRARSTNQHRRTERRSGFTRFSYWTWYRQSFRDSGLMETYRSER